MIQLSSLMPHPNNPRKISDEGFEKLKKSLQDFPEMLTKERIAYDEDGTIWSGSQRHRALIELGYKEIPENWTDSLFGWTEKQKTDLMFRKNEHYGEWDQEKLNDHWNDYDWFALSDKALSEFKIEDYVPLEQSDSDEPNVEHEQKWMLNIETENETNTQKLYEEMTSRGFMCKIIT